MARIRVEIDVPKDDCQDCNYYDACTWCCKIFGDYLFFDDEKNIVMRCYDCKNSEVKE